MGKLISIVVGICLSGVTLLQAQRTRSTLTLHDSLSTRINTVMERLTPEEKFNQLFLVCEETMQDTNAYQHGIFGLQWRAKSNEQHAVNQMMQYHATEDAFQILNQTNSIQRYFVEHSSSHLPILFVEEALHGLVQKGATCFPQSIGMAASFDTVLMNQVAHAIALETKARGIRMVLSPVLNLATDVRWGRVEETYGEDPLLVSKMGTAYIKGFEHEGVLTTPKHFIVNHGDGGRDSYPIALNRRYLEEFYLKPFKAAIQHGHAGAIMTAYNSFNGQPCSSNPFLLNQLLRRECSFQGIVMSDAGATGGANVLHFTASDYNEAGKQSVEAGLDVIFQSNINSYPLFKEAFLTNKVNQAAIDSAVYRVLKKKEEIGLLDQPYTSDSLLQALNMPAHKALAYQMAIESAVLLKNKSSCLPLSCRNKKILVVGTDATEARMGGYSGPGNQVVSILDGIKQEFGRTHTVHYLPACSRSIDNYTVVPASNVCHKTNGVMHPGLEAAYYNAMTTTVTPALARIDANINFQWTLFGPAENINFDHFAVEWNGYYRADTTATIELGIDGNDGWQLFINDQLFLDRSNDQSVHRTTRSIAVRKHSLYKIKIVYRERSGNTVFRFIQNKDRTVSLEKKIQEAEKALQQQDVCIVVAGIEEGEFRDRSKLSLPGNQEELILRLAKQHKPIIVLLVGGSAITMSSWIDQVDAVLNVWYPGEEGGRALAHLLCGKANPSGKLPISFPQTEGQLPFVYNHLPTGRGDDYMDGSGHALFPFGYGLSYTQFEYGNLKLNTNTFSDTQQVRIEFDITNTGKYPGSEVAQLYIHDELASIARPVKELKNFERVNLKPGELKHVVFTLNPSDLSFPNEQLDYITEPGSFRIMIGSSSQDIRLRTIIHYHHE